MCHGTSIIYSYNQVCTSTKQVCTKYVLSTYSMYLVVRTQYVLILVGIVFPKPRLVLLGLRTPISVLHDHDGIQVTLRLVTVHHARPVIMILTVTQASTPSTSLYYFTFPVPVHARYVPVRTGTY
jgi:hypothetical protein